MDLLGSHFLVFVAIGLCAQLIDGALGMAYGLVTSSILLAMGMPPAAVSASVHTAEIFTTGVSGAAHGMLGNVDRRLMLRLAVPGVVGGVIGASLLSRIDGDAIKPWIHGYLFVLALLILLRAAGRRLPRGEVRRSACWASSRACSMPSAAAAGGRWRPRPCLPAVARRAAASAR